MYLKHPVISLFSSLATFIVTILVGNLMLFLSEMSANPAVRSVDDSFTMFASMLGWSARPILPMTVMGKGLIIFMIVVTLILAVICAFAIITLVTAGLRRRSEQEDSVEIVESATVADATGTTTIVRDTVVTPTSVNETTIVSNQNYNTDGDFLTVDAEENEVPEVEEAVVLTLHDDEDDQD